MVDDNTGKLESKSNDSVLEFSKIVEIVGNAKSWSFENFFFLNLSFLVL